MDHVELLFVNKLVPLYLCHGWASVRLSCLIPSLPERNPGCRYVVATSCPRHNHTRHTTSRVTSRPFIKLIMFISKLLEMECVIYMLIPSMPASITLVEQHWPSPPGQVLQVQLPYNVPPRERQCCLSVQLSPTSQPTSLKKRRSF